MRGRSRRDSGGGEADKFYYRSLQKNRPQSPRFRGGEAEVPALAAPGPGRAAVAAIPGGGEAAGIELRFNPPSPRRSRRDSGGGEAESSPAEAHDVSRSRSRRDSGGGEAGIGIHRGHKQLPAAVAAIPGGVRRFVTNRSGHSPTLPQSPRFRGG